MDRPARGRIPGAVGRLFGPQRQSQIKRVAHIHQPALAPQCVAQPVAQADDNRGVAAPALPPIVDGQVAVEAQLLQQPEECVVALKASAAPAPFHRVFPEFRGPAGTGRRLWRGCAFGNAESAFPGDVLGVGCQ